MSSSAPNAAPERVVIIGLGRAGTALARGLAQRAPTTPLLLWGPRPPRWGDRLPAPPQTHRPRPAAGDLWLLAVPDDAIQSCAGSLAADSHPHAVYLHLSGSREVGSLSALSPAPIGGFHPLQALVPDRDWSQPGGFYAALEGGPQAHAAGLWLCARLGLEPATLRPGGRAAYHRGAVMAGNLILGLLDQAIGSLVEAGIPRETARAMLLPLSRGALDNADRLGCARALTGPIARGDADTVRLHLEGLPEGSVRQSYLSLSRQALELARAAGPRPGHDALSRVLGQELPPPGAETPDQDGI